MAFSRDRYHPTPQKTDWMSAFRDCSEFAVKCRRDARVSQDGSWHNGLICPFEYNG